MWPTRFLIFKVVIERLFPPFGENSFGVPLNHIAGIDVPTTVPTAIVPSTSISISISFMVKPQRKPPWISGKVGEKCFGHVVYGETYWISWSVSPHLVDVRAIETISARMNPASSLE